MKKYYAMYKVVGSTESLIEFDTLLGLINYCCRTGSSRTIRVDVDGDGSACLKISKLNEKNEEKEVDINTEEVAMLEKAINTSFFGSYDEEAKEETESAMKDFDERIRKFKDSGSDIRINIGE
jgi:hypothetical protein